MAEDKFEPIENDVIVQKSADQKQWEALHYSKGTKPKLVYRDTNRSLVRRKGSEFAAQHGTKCYMRLPSGSIILEDKDNKHLVAAVSDGGVEQEA